MRGFSTLELMIAMAIMLIVFTGVVTSSFGPQSGNAGAFQTVASTQSLMVGAQTDSEALKLAQRMMEQEQAYARQDFNLVNALDVWTSDGYHKTVKVTLLPPDYVTKQIVVKVSWIGEHGQPRDVTLNGLITNFENSIGADTCNSAAVGDWSHAAIKNIGTTDFASLSGGGSGTYSITGMDAYKGRLYVTTSNSSANQPTFFVFNIANDPIHPQLVGKIDNDSANNTGLQGVRAAEGTDNKTYAYVVNASSFTKGQFQVFPVRNTDGSDIGLSTGNIVTYKIPTTAVATAGLGNSVFYSNGYAFVGLTKSAPTSTEFNVIDIHNPLAPIRVGGYQVGYDVNAIFVRGQYAYVAHPTDSATSSASQEQVTVLDLTNLAKPRRVSGFHAPDNQGNGKSLSIVGDSLYLGRTVGAGPELYVLDNTDPTQLATANSATVGNDVSASVDGFIIRDYLRFLLTKNDLQIYNATTSGTSIVALPGAGSATEPTMDCEGNYLYVGANDVSGKGSLYVVGQ